MAEALVWTWVIFLVDLIVLILPGMMLALSSNSTLEDIGQWMLRVGLLVLCGIGVFAAVQMVRVALSVIG